MKLRLFNTAWSAGVELGNVGGCSAKYNGCILKCWIMSCGTELLGEAAH